MAQDKKAKTPKLTVKPAELRRERLEMVVQLTNPLSRAVHFISEPRGITYDSASGRIKVRLSDAGAEVIPGGMIVTPRFRRIDPGDTSEVKLALPRTIVRLAPTSSPDTEPRMEEIDLTQASEIEVEIGWNDTPFYHDPRKSTEVANPIAAWERGRLKAVGRLKAPKGKTSQKSKPKKTKSPTRSKTQKKGKTPKKSKPSDKKKGR